MATEFLHDDSIIVLEGRTVEIFHRLRHEPMRYHVAFLGVYVQPKGDKYKVKLGAGHGETVLGGVTLTLDAAQFGRFREFIGLATAARDSAPNPQ